MKLWILRLSNKSHNHASLLFRLWKASRFGFATTKNVCDALLALSHEIVENNATPLIPHPTLSKLLK